MSAQRATVQDDQDDNERVQAKRNAGLTALLESWAVVSPDERAEQQDTWEFLRKALDEDRPEGSKLFP